MTFLAPHAAPNQVSRLPREQAVEAGTHAQTSVPSERDQLQPAQLRVVINTGSSQGHLQVDFTHPQARGTVSIEEASGLT